MNMNRVFVGIISLLVVVGIVVLAARALQTINARRQTQQAVPTSGKLALPSGQPLSSTAASARPVSTPSFFTSPLPVTSAKPTPKPTGFPVPSPSGKLPATGLF